MGQTKPEKRHHRELGANPGNHGTWHFQNSPEIIEAQGNSHPEHDQAKPDMDQLNPEYLVVLVDKPPEMLRIKPSPQASYDHPEGKGIG